MSLTSVLFEQPIAIGILGVIAIVGSLIGLLNTGSTRFLYVAGIMLIATVGLLFVESWVVTPREEIKQTLQDIAADLESNDTRRILRHIATSAATTKPAAERALKRFEIGRVSVKDNLVVEFDSHSDPRQATARFNAVIVGSERSGAIRNQTSPFFFIVEFVKEAGSWRVAEYDRLPPHEGLRRSDS